MSFQRNIYDPQSYDQQLQESVNAGKYQLLSDYANHSGRCFQTNPGNNSGNSGIMEIGTIVDAESDLQNLNRRLSKDPKKNYPFIGQTQEHKYGSFCGTPPNFETSYSMLDIPKPNREKGILKHHYETLCMDPQKLVRIHDNSYIGRNTRLWERDNYIPKLPKPLQPQNNVKESFCNQCSMK
jgi:hypothetical protein